jgi:hypothetical protein
MIATFILVMVFQSGHGVATIVQEYSTEAKCKAAMDLNRERLKTMNVQLATCTAK